MAYEESWSLSILSWTEAPWPRPLSILSILVMGVCGCAGDEGFGLKAEIHSQLLAIGWEE